MVRNVLAGVLLLGALLSGLAGTALHWVDHVARSPEPTEQLVTIVSRDEAVIGAVADQMVAAVDQRIPEVASQVPELKAELTTVIRAGVDAAMDNPDVDAVWRDVLGSSRTTLVSDLRAYALGLRDTAPSVTVDLAPFLDRVWSSVRSAVDSRLSGFLDDVELPDQLPVTVAQLPPPAASLAGTLLDAATFWWLVYCLAVVLLVGAVVLATGVARWVLLAVMAALGAVVVAAGRHLAGLVTFDDPGNQVTSALRTSVARQLTESLSAWYDPFWYGCLALVGVGIVGAIVAGVRARGR